MVDSGTNPQTGGSRRYVVAWCFIAALMTLAIFFRVTQLEDFPSFIHNDEAAAAVYISPPFLGANPQSPLWGFNNYGRHANFGAWLTSLSVTWFGGQTLWAIRMGSVVCGFLSIVLSVLFIRSWLGFQTAFFFLAAIVPFHLHVFYSRTGFHYIQAATFAALVSYLFGRVVRVPNAKNGVFLGVGLGFALMVYSATLVLPAAVMVGLLALFSSSAMKGVVPAQRFKNAAVVGGALVVGLLLSMGQHLYHISKIGFSSRLDSQSVLHRIPVEQRGGFFSHLDLLWASFERTLWFFYYSDAAGQYGYLGRPLELCSYLLASLGVLVLLYRCCRLDPNAVYIVVLCIATIVGSALMIEANFSPHLIVFSLFIPLACAIGAAAVCQALRLRSLLVSGVLAVCLLIPWTIWNYAFISARESRKYNMDTYILHLPIDRNSVKTTVNFTPFYGDLRESFYKLQYPNARPIKVEIGDVPQQVLELHTTQVCPCLVIVQRTTSEAVLRRLTEGGRKFTTFQVPRPEADVFVIE